MTELQQVISKHNISLKYNRFEMSLFTAHKQYCTVPKQSWLFIQPSTQTHHNSSLAHGKPQLLPQLYLQTLLIVISKGHMSGFASCSCSATNHIDFAMLLNVFQAVMLWRIFPPIPNTYFNLYENWCKRRPCSSVGRACGPCTEAVSPLQQS